MLDKAFQPRCEAALEPGQLLVELESRALDTTTVHLHGELDLATAPQAEGAIRDLYARGHTTLALDLSRLTFMDAAGLRLLIGARTHARTIGSRLEIMLGNGCARRLAELTETVEHLQGRPNRALETSLG
jgi:anti-sigma B factor antagonist